MAVLEKMRKRMGVFISIVIAIALLGFIVNIDDLQRILSMFSSKYNVGEIAGKTITQQEFSKRLDKYTRLIGENQNADPEENSDMLKNITWQSFITDYVIVPACQKAGIMVGEDEMVDMTRPGLHTSPVIMNEPMFLDQNGMIDSDKVQQFMQALGSDQSGQLSEYWSYLQDNMMHDRMFTKYSVMIAQSAYSNNLQARREVAENNNSYDIDFILQPITFSLDSTIAVSNEEIRKYYENIKPSLKKVETRDAKVAIFPIEPSEKDIKAAKDEIETLFAEFKDVADADVQQFIDRNSDTKYNGIYFKSGDLREISAIVDEFVAQNGAGSYLDPQPYDNFFISAKVLDVAARPDSVYLMYTPVPDEKTADSVIANIKTGSEFTAFAANYIPQQNALEPGTIGWITEPLAHTQLPEDFLKAFSSKKGDMFKFEFNGTQMVARVDNVTKPVRKAKVALLTKQATASKETYSLVYEKAMELKANSNSDINVFEKYALDNGIELIPAENLVGGQKTISSYDKMREVNRWIFEAKTGNISDIMEVDSKYYVVAALDKIHPAGYAELESLAPQIREHLAMEKRVDDLARELGPKVSGATTIEEAAEKLDLSISNLTDVTFSSLNAGAQTDPVFIGAISGAGSRNDNGLIGPVKGAMGIAFFQIRDKKNNAFFTESDAQRKNEQNVMSIIRALPQIMSESAGIEDKRYRAF